MIERILAGGATGDDAKTAGELAFEGRKKLMGGLLATLEEQFRDAVMLEEVLKDLGNALGQARPVLMAGLGVDQSVGMVASLVQSSIDQLEEEGEAESDEHDKQVAVLEALNRFAAGCQEAGTLAGEEALATILSQYDTEKERLEGARRTAEEGIANSLSFLERAFGRGEETDAFVKGLDRSVAAVRFIGKFGSESFFAYKHVAAPGTAYAAEPEIG